MKTAKRGFQQTIILFAMAMFAGATLAADWPCYRGPNKDGATSERIERWPPVELWRANVGQGYSCVAVGGGRVYTAGWTTNTDFIYCFSESSTGTNPAPLWVQSYPCGSVSYEGTRATPTIDGSELYMYSHEGRLGCYDKTTGSSLWSKTVTGGRPGWGFGSSVWIEGTQAVVNAGGHGKAVDKTHPGSHNTIWGDDEGSSAAGYASPYGITIGTQRTVVVFGGQYATGVNPANGAMIWRYSWAQGMADPIIYNNKLFVSCGYSKGSSVINLSTGILSNPIWSNTQIANKENCSVFYNGYVYGMSEGSGLRCVNFDTGVAMWTSSFAFGTESALMRAGDELVVINGTDGGGNNGDLVVVSASPGGYTELHRWDNIVSGNTWTTPTLANGKLYIRSHEGTLVCYDVSPEQPGTGVVQFSSASYSVGEGGGTAAITVVRTNNSSASVTVTCASSNGTATAGADYTAVSTNITFSTGETSKTFYVSILQDSTRESAETINLTLSNVSTGAVFGSPIAAVLTINDDDIALVVQSAHGTVTPPVGTNGYSIQSGSLNVQINQSSDDARESVSTGWGKLNSTSLDTVDHPTYGNQYVGFRFNNVTVPGGMAITRAYIQFTSYSATTNVANYTIHAQAADSPATFIATNFDMATGARQRTTASAAWSPANWTAADQAGSDQRTPDLSALVQELVSRSGWASGNSMAFIFSGSGQRIACTYDGTPAKSAVLHIEWATGVRCVVLNSPVVSGSTQYVCSGWIGTGSVPSGGSTTNTGFFALSNDSSIVWLWTTNAQGGATTTNGEVPYTWIDQHYPGTTNYESAATADSDGDGMQAWEEYWAGTDPTNSGSAFVVTNSTMDATGGVFRLSWRAAAGKKYRVYVSTNIVAGWPVNPVASNLDGGSFSEPHGMRPNVFYRIGVER